MRENRGGGNCGQDLLYEGRFYFQLKINGCSTRKSQLSRARREIEQVSQTAEDRRVKMSRIVSERKNWCGRGVITEEIQIFPRTEEQPKPPAQWTAIGPRQARCCESSHCQEKEGDPAGFRGPDAAGEKKVEDKEITIYNDF